MFLIHLVPNLKYFNWLKDIRQSCRSNVKHSLPYWPVEFVIFYFRYFCVLFAYDLWWIGFSPVKLWINSDSLSLHTFVNIF